jgi:hypothetical protein
MATYTKVKLSGSTDGRMIKVAATATLGTTIHAAHATALDEIWLYAVNSDSTARKLTIEFGGATSPDNLIEITIQPEAGLELVVPGLLLTNSLSVTAFCATTNVVMIGGYVNRIT